MWGDAARRPEIKPGQGEGIHRHSAFSLLGRGQVTQADDTRKGKE